MGQRERTVRETFSYGPIYVSILNVSIADKIMLIIYLFLQ